MDVLTITEAAAARIDALLAQKTPRPEAVMVSVTSKGCSGLSYDLQVLDKLEQKPKFADVVTAHGVTVVVDPKAALYMTGSVMDYREDALRSGFEFTNPNETGRCGCGESFTVAPVVAPVETQH
jgi:iron-sulfur cluster assembly protein